MESDRQKWVNLVFVAAAGALAWILFSLVQKFAGTYDLESRIPNFQWVLRGTVLAVGLLSFIILYRHEKANQFMHEVIVELGRVTWPTQQETSKGTVVVVVFVLVAGFILGSLDTFWAWMMKFIL